MILLMVSPTTSSTGIQFKRRLLQNKLKRAFGSSRGVSKTYDTALGGHREESKVRQDSIGQTPRKLPTWLTEQITTKTKDNLRDRYMSCLSR